MNLYCCFSTWFGKTENSLLPLQGPSEHVLSKMVGRGTYPIVCGSLGKSRKRQNKDRERKMGNNFSENEPANSICIIGNIAALLLDGEYANVQGWMRGVGLLPYHSPTSPRR